MKINKDSSFSRWMAIHNSILENSLDGVLSDKDWIRIDPFIDKVSKIDFIKCKAEYLYKNNSIKIQLFGIKENDTVIFEYSLKNLQVEILSGYDIFCPQNATKRYFSSLRKLLSYIFNLMLSNVSDLN